ncbi:Rv3654c family TadE-like protein [Micromonospora haikouensis]|uniref:Rv3654c family TadE-like protein n=1 Tax=Micromonospora haikouensis TaxID=686309 RepID=UPI0009E1B231
MAAPARAAGAPGNGRSGGAGTSGATVGRRCGGGRGGVAVGRRCGGDRGGATVCLLAVGLMFVIVGVFGAAVEAARVARQRAAVAADFAALAAAAQALTGGEVACASADAVARANGARLAGCRLDGLDAVVATEVTVTPVPGLTRVATATARAGPARA